MIRKDLAVPWTISPDDLIRARERIRYIRGDRIHLNLRLSRPNDLVNRRIFDAERRGGK